MSSAQKRTVIGVISALVTAILVLWKTAPKSHNKMMQDLAEIVQEAEDLVAQYESRVALTEGERADIANQLEQLRSRLESAGEGRFYESFEQEAALERRWYNAAHIMLLLSQGQLPSMCEIPQEEKDKQGFIDLENIKKITSGIDSEVGAILEDIDELNREVISLLESGQFFNVQSISITLNNNFEHINKLKNLIAEQTGLSDADKEIYLGMLDKQLDRLKNIAKTITEHNTSLIALDLKIYALDPKKITIEIIYALSDKLKEQGFLSKFLNQDGLEQFNNRYEEISQELKKLLKTLNVMTKEIDAFINELQRIVQSNAPISGEQVDTLNARLTDYLDKIEKYVPKDRRYDLRQQLLNLQVELNSKKP